MDLTTTAPIQPGAAPPAAAVEAAPPVDPSFGTAFAVGWRTASLYIDASFDNERREGRRDDLPDPGALSPRARTNLTADLIEAGLRKLGGQLAAAGIEQIPMKELREALATSPGDVETLRRRAQELHVDVLFALTAADFRLGKAYGAGHVLAEICLQPADRASFDRAFGPRVVSLRNWLADLASTLPPHASRAVVVSLRTWEAWAAEPKLDGEPLDWPTHGAGVRAALRRQGELWRELLSGEKQGPDMLDINHYLRAANALVATMTSTIWRFLRPLALPLGAAILLLGGGIALLVLTGAVGQVFGALAAAAGAVGITGAGLRARLGKVATQLETRLWGAELDLAIAEAILIGPKGWGATVADVTVPATGAAPRVAANLETLHEFREAVRAKRGSQVSDLLAADVEFIAGDQARSGRDVVATWLLQAPESTRIASEPQKVVAAGPGILVTYVDTGADVWRVQEGKIRRWQSFADRDRARDAAGLPPEEHEAD